MEFMGYHILDIIVVALIVFLAIKGLVNGFSKELFSLLTIAGGVILAARYNENVIQMINEQHLFPQIPDDFSKPIGFILILLSVWLIIGLISSIITKLTGRSTGFISRLLGYVLSVTRYVFIFALIAFGVNQSEFFKDSTEKYKVETQLFEPMAQLGAEILNVELNETSELSSSNSEVNLTIDSILPTLTEYNSSN